MTNQPSTVTAPAIDPAPVFLPAASPNGAPSPNGSDSPNGAPPPGPTRPAKRPRGSRLRYVVAGGVLAVLAAAGVGAYSLTAGPKGPRADLILYKVRSEPLNLTVVERGA